MRVSDPNRRYIELDGVRDRWKRAKICKKTHHAVFTILVALEVELRLVSMINKVASARARARTHTHTHAHTHAHKQTHTQTQAQTNTHTPTNKTHTNKHIKTH